MTLESLAQLLLGATFGLKVVDARKPVWARLGFGLVAADLIKSGLAGENGLLPRFGDAGENEALPAALKTPLKFKAYRVATIQDRVAKVHEQMIAGTKDPKIYALARQVVTARAGDDWAVGEKDHRGEAKAIFDEVRKRVRYTWDPTDYDAFQTAVRTLELHAGDCDDLTSLLGSLLRSIGHECRSRIVQTKGASTWNHIYLTVKVGAEWLPLDASVAKPAFWEVPDAMVLKKQDFDVVGG